MIGAILRTARFARRVRVLSTSGPDPLDGCDNGRRTSRGKRRRSRPADRCRDGRPRDQYQRIAPLPDRPIHRVSAGDGPSQGFGTTSASEQAEGTWNGRRERETPGQATPTVDEDDASGVLVAARFVGAEAQGRCFSRDASSRRASRGARRSRPSAAPAAARPFTAARRGVRRMRLPFTATVFP